MAAPTPTILILDADAASRNYLASTLKKSQVNVILASSGKEGLVVAWQSLPDLVVIDPALPDISGLNLIARLRQDRRTATVPCVALCGQENPEEMAALLSAGFNECLVKSGEATTRLVELIPRSGEGGDAPRKSGLLVGFLSAKGGTGTTSLCANLAMCTGAIFTQANIAVLDMVLPVGSLDQIVGYAERLNLVTAAAQNPELMTASYFKDNLPKFPAWNFRLLVGSPDPGATGKLQVERIPDLITALQEGFDGIFIDLGRTLSRISIPVIQRVDVLVLVLGADAGTVKLTKTILSYLESQNFDRQRIYPILNRSVGMEGLSKSEIDRELGIEVKVTIPYLGSDLSAANNRHEPVAALSGKDSSTMVFMQTARQIIEMAQRLRKP